MTNRNDTIHGLSLEQWSSAFRPGMPEFAAHQFAFTAEEPDLVRIAFGNGGPVVDATGTRKPVFTHAVTITPALAVELARQLLKHYAQPDAERRAAAEYKR